MQTVQAGHVTSQIIFHFTDGSVHDETTVFSQNNVFRLLSYHLCRRARHFGWTLDMTIDTQTGRVVVRHKDQDGEEEVEDEKLDLRSDVANGMMIPVLKNLSSQAVPATASFVAATPEPVRSKLAHFESAGSESIVDCRFQSPRHALCRQGRDWRRCRDSLHRSSANNRPTRTCGFSRAPPRLSSNRKDRYSTEGPYGGSSSQPGVGQAQNRDADGLEAR